MNGASLETLHLAARLLDQTGAGDSSVRAEIRHVIHNSQWRVFQRLYHARQLADARAASVASQAVASQSTEPLLSTPTNGLRRHAGGSAQPVNGTTTPCALCLRFFVGPGSDCMEITVSHAPGVAMVVCAPCVFYEMSCMAPSNTLVHDVARVYHK